MTGLQRSTAQPHGAGPWQQYGACCGQDTAIFFAPDGEQAGRRALREAAAKTLCASCPVRLACSSHALAEPEPYGVWGGLSERERDLLVTEDRRRALSQAGANAAGRACLLTEPAA